MIRWRSRWRYRTTIIAFFAAASMLVLAVAYQGFRHEFHQTVVRNERPQLQRLARHVARRFYRGKLDAERAASRADRVLGFAVYRSDGTLLARRAGPLLDVQIPDWFVASVAGDTGATALETLRSAAGAEIRALAASFVPRSKSFPNVGPIVVVTFRSMDALHAQVAAEAWDALVHALPIALGAAVILGWLVARSLARPLRRMADEASHASLAADASVEVPESGTGDELDALAVVLNTTFRRLRTVYERQSRFTSDAAHELRTPIAAILGRTDVVLRRPRSDEEYRAALTDVRDVAARSAEMVESLLRLARLDTGNERHATPVDIGRVTRTEVIAARDRTAAESVEIRFRPPDEDCTVAGDEALLAVVVRNLLENALVHGRSDGGVDVSVGCDAAEVVVTVSDHGVGVPASECDRIFDRLYRSDGARTRARGGAGLGLTLVREIARAHGGDATAESSLGHGLQVTVRFDAFRVTHRAITD